MSGYTAYSGQFDFRSEGWKFHISADPWNAEEMAQLVMPVLQFHNVKHKYLQLNQLRTRIGVEVGKFIAYYPYSCAHAHMIAAAISGTLTGQRCAQGPIVKNEQPFGTSGVLYTRYGSYTSEFVIAPGVELKSVDPPRGYRPYHDNGTIRPSWITPLLDDNTNTLFPKYNPRNMRYWKESDLPWKN